MTLRVRGIVFQSALLFLRSRLSPPEQAALWDRLDGDVRALMDGAVEGGAWIPATALARLMEASAAFLPEPPEETYRRMGRQSCDDTLISAYRQMSRFPRPEFILRRAVRLWRDYYDRGDLEVLEAAPEAGVVRVKGAQFPHPALCHRVRGWMERAIEITGGREVVVAHSTCAFGTGGEMEVWRAQWRI